MISKLDVKIPLVVAREDKLTLTDLTLRAYERALEPKRLALIPGGHFDPYLGQFPRAQAAATAWFREHLVGAASATPVRIPHNF
jgi:hypothetical protein